MDFSNLGGALEELANQMGDAVDQGMNAIGQAGTAVAKDMNPDHEVEVNIKLEATIDGHDYKVDSKIIFEIELAPIIAAAEHGTEGLSELLDGLDVDMGDDKDAIMEQLGQPRAVGTVKEIETEELEVSNKDGKVEAELNKKGTIMLTLDGDDVHVNFDSVLSYPEHTDLLVAIPSTEKMQENIVLSLKDLDKKVKFEWEEEDKDGLEVSGDIVVKKI